MNEKLNSNQEKKSSLFIEQNRTEQKKNFWLGKGKKRIRINQSSFEQYENRMKAIIDKSHPKGLESFSKKSS